MRFLRQYQYVFYFLAALVVCSVMVIRQSIANNSAHYERREDFILLNTRAELEAAQQHYDLLVHEMPSLSDAVLANDLQRTSLLLDGKSCMPEDLICRYNVGVSNELQKRAERRLGKLLHKPQD